MVMAMMMKVAGSSTAPASADAADLAANRHFDGFRNRWFFDPVFGKGYPQDLVETFVKRGADTSSFIQPGDLEVIAAPLDFVGVNYYTALAVAAGHEEEERTWLEPGPNPPAGFTEMGWEIVPSALTTFLRRIHDDYGANVILFTDEYPTQDQARWEEILDRIIALDLELYLLMETRAADIVRDRAFLDKYRKAGIVHVYVGLEATEQETLDRVRKGLQPGRAVLWRVEGESLTPVEVTTGIIGEKVTEVSGADLAEGMTVAVPPKRKDAKRKRRFGLSLF